MNNSVSAPVSAAAEKAWAASSGAAQRYLRLLLAIGVINTAAVLLVPVAALGVLNVVRPGQGLDLFAGVPAPLILAGFLLFVPLLGVYWQVFARTLVLSSLAVTPDGLSLEYLGGRTEFVPWRRVRGVKLYRDRDGHSRFIALSYRDKTPTLASKSVHLPQCLFALDEVWRTLEESVPAGIAAGHGTVPFTSLPRAAAAASVFTVSIVTAAVVAVRLFF